MVAVSCIQYAIRPAPTAAMNKSLACESPIANVSLGELVHQRMVEAIVTGQFRGGEELNEVLLAERFSVSRTPVREALRRLAVDGLVVNQHNRQATVVELSRDDVIQAYQVRQILEAAAARLAAQNISSTQLAELRALAAAALPPAEGQWGSHERQFDEALHHAVAESCGNARLQQEIVRYSNLVRLVRARVARCPQRLAQGHAEHMQIVGALEAGDPIAAENAMSAHIASALTFVLQDLPLV